MLGFMSFDFECEVCKKLVNKTPYKLSMSQHITNGGIIECKECKARYKSKFRTSFLYDTIGLGSVFVVALCILWIIYMMNYSKNVDSIILPAVLGIVGCMVIQVVFGALMSFFTPVRKIGAGDKIDIK